jgi:exodeoxyribonuclease V alpha subunit
MTPSVEQLEAVRELFPKASAELAALFANAREHAGLAYADLLTLRDLLAVSDSSSEPLAALVLILLVALEEGSLSVDLSDAALARRLTDLAAADAIETWVRRIRAELEGDVFPDLIGRKHDENRPLVILESAGARHIYFQKYLHHDLIFRDEMQHRLGAAAASSDLDALVKRVLDEPSLDGDGRPLRLDACQRRALETALARSCAVISGGPGTGKTSIVLTLVRCLVRAGYRPDRIALAAPTGRAAQRLTDALRGGLSRLPAGWRDGADGPLESLTAHTVHHLLRYRPTRGTFAHHSENPLPADVVIVDEVSMVGLVLMAQLLQALRPDTKLVLLGDKDQLPSVDAGAVLASLVATPTGPASNGGRPGDFVVVLEENYRSQPDIRAAGQAVNAQDTTLLARLPALTGADETETTSPFGEALRRGGCWWLPIAGTSTAPLRRVLTRWAHEQYLKTADDICYADLAARIRLAADEGGADLDALFRLCGRARLLTVLREGSWGCEEINRFLAEQLRPKWDRVSRGELFAGAPVLITRNDHLRQLYNGDVGIALRSHGGGLRVVFARSDGYVSFPADTLPAHELGFALTVHKSQGSEYDQVLLVVPPSGGRRLLTKEIVYTGVTRAKQLAILCGTKEALELAISRRIVRESALQIRPAQSASASASQ